MLTTIDFTRRAKVRETAAGTNRTYRSRCGEFAVIECRPLGYPRQWLAVQCLSNGNQSIISRHKTRAGAEAACQEFAEK